MSQELPLMIRDQAARDAIRTRLDETMLVEAAAGTGKTTSLVARMVNLVRSGSARASSIAAITFTLKAAAQLRERFHEELERVSKAPADAAEQERLRDALAEIDRGFIGTTHAFCARLLRERPVEAGLDPEFEELDDVAMALLTREFWDRWWEAQAVSRPELLGEARAAGLDRGVLRDAFAVVVANPDVRLAGTRTQPPDLGAACRAISEFLDHTEPSMPPRGEERDDFAKLMRALIDLRRSLDLDDREGQLHFLDEADHGNRKLVQKHWPDGKLAKRLHEEYAQLVATTLAGALQRWREYVHGVAVELLAPAAAEFQRERRASARLSFNDLLLCARDLLRDHPHVRLYFQRRFTHLLVDEFQDTDPLQAEVVFYLAGIDTDERDWRKLVPRPGSLFIVGDPKQSIYRFRRADITTYLAVRQRIAETGGRVEQLVTNFRSAPQICSFSNAVFNELFVQQDVDAGRQAAPADLADHRQPASATGVYRLETQDGKNEEMAAREAECVARWIRASVDGGSIVDDGAGARPARWGDFLLVSWRRTRLGAYASALEKEGIPYVVTGSRAFDPKCDLAVAMPLLRAVVDPEDPVAVVAFLRGRLCGADDDALFRFRRDHGSFNPVRTLPSTADEAIARGIALLRASIEDARQLPPAAAIARIFERAAIVPLAASRERAGTRSGTLLLALAIAREESARGSSINEIVDAFAEMIESSPDIGELDVDPARENAVRLMNLHQVKGLEAPVVFLIDPADPRDFAPTLVVDRSGGDSVGHLLITRKNGNHATKAIAQPQAWQQLDAGERLFSEAERRRLLYVAATRAKNLLVVGFRHKKGVPAGPWRELAGRITDALFAAPADTARAASAAAIARQFEAAQTELRERLESSSAASYSVLPITKLAHGDHQQIVRNEEGLGRGTSWGRVLHRLFEALLRDEAIDVKRHAANLLKDEERDAAELADVVRAVEALRASTLWKRVMAADERYAEVPFAINVPRSEVGLAGEGTTLLHGTIDLVFREKDRWFVVDYKSDRTGADQMALPGFTPASGEARVPPAVRRRIESLTAYYAPQVRHYARFWQELTHRPTSAALFFVDGSIERWIVTAK